MVDLLENMRLPSMTNMMLTSGVHLLHQRVILCRGIRMFSLRVGLSQARLQHAKHWMSTHIRCASLNHIRTMHIPRMSKNMHCQYRTRLHNCTLTQSYYLCTQASCNSDDIPPATTFHTVTQAIKWWTETFSRSGVPEAAISAKYIVAHAIGFKQLHELTNHILCRKLSRSEKLVINDLCKKRLERMPVQYIIGEWDFRDLTLVMKPPVFIPCPETELLVELVLGLYPANEDVHFLEIGCGSGAISISLLKELPKARVSAIEQSQEACKLTAKNAARQGILDRLTIHHSEFGQRLPSCLQGCSFDAIVSNPPYIATEDMKHVDEEVTRYIDNTALHGGADGLSVIKNICQQARYILKPNSYIWMETDTYQADMIDEWLQKNSNMKLTFLKMYKDLTDRPRFCQLQLEQ